MRTGNNVKKDLLVLLAVVLLAVFVIRGTEIQSVDEYYLTHIDDISEDSETVFLSIRCDTILENWDALDSALRSEQYVPKDGVILQKTEYVLRPGDSVFDLLSRATRHHKIQMEYQGVRDNGYGSAYIRGIHYLYEFSCGPLSGWLYTVNGAFSGYGCSKYFPKDGDVIEWKYTCDLGRDVGNDSGSGLQGR